MLMQELITMDDLRAFLQASDCRITMGATANTWRAVVTQNGISLGDAEHLDWVGAVRGACVQATASLERRRVLAEMVVH